MQLVFADNGLTGTGVPITPDFEGHSFGTSTHRKSAADLVADKVGEELERECEVEALRGWDKGSAAVPLADTGNRKNHIVPCATTSG
jgi:hypothetical protein